jgi:hypothetical protein
MMMMMMMMMMILCLYCDDDCISFKVWMKHLDLLVMELEEHKVETKAEGI